MRKWDDHCAVPVGMDQIAIAHGHAEDAHLGAEGNGLGVRMRSRDVSREKLKPRRPLVEIANRAIGDQSQRAQADVNFFFSSRRRHTRSKRDWSSDVCSSD